MIKVMLSQVMKVTHETQSVFIHEVDKRTVKYVRLCSRYKFLLSFTQIITCQYLKKVLEYK